VRGSVDGSNAQLRNEAKLSSLSLEIEQEKQADNLIFGAELDDLEGAGRGK
jgi:hypothetical protein